MTVRGGRMRAADATGKELAMHAASAAARAFSAILRRILPLIVLAAGVMAAALGANIATSTEVRAEWAGDCGPGGEYGFFCSSVGEACSTVAGRLGEDFLGVDINAAGNYATCHTTPRLGGYTTFNTALSCPGGKVIDIGWGAGCAPPEPDLGPCPTCGGTPTGTGPGSPSGPVGGDGTGSGGNPVAVDNGNKYEAVTDYRSSGADTLEFTRYYNGLTTRRFNMGLRWRHNFSAILELPSGTTTKAHRPNGRVETFTSATGSDPWTPTLGGVVGRRWRPTTRWASFSPSRRKTAIRRPLNTRPAACPAFGRSPTATAAR
jgi:hypothetical protein